MSEGTLELVEASSDFRLHTLEIVYEIGDFGG